MVLVLGGFIWGRGRDGLVVVAPGRLTLQLWSMHPSFIMGLFNHSIDTLLNRKARSTSKLFFVSLTENHRASQLWQGRAGKIVEKLGKCPCLVLVEYL